MELATVLPFVYNAGFFMLFVLWIVRDRIQFSKRMDFISVKYLWIAAILFFILITIANFTVLATDVDDAITGAIKAFIFDGANPYVDKVVPHNPDGDNWILSVYHYFPPDLLIYSALFLPLSVFQTVFDNLGLNNGWLFIANVFLAIISFYFIWCETAKEKRKKMTPLFLMLISPFLLNNSILMLFLYTIAITFINKSRETNPFRNHLIKIMEFLSAGVKYMTGVFIAVEFIRESELSLRNREIRNLYPYLTGSLVFIFLTIPFGMIDVFIATILYQSHPDYREGVAEINGPLLVEILAFINLESFYFVIFLLSGIVALIITLFLYKELHEQQIFLSFVIMFILPFYGTELFIIPLFALFYHDFLSLETNLFDNKAKKTQEDFSEENVKT